MNHLNNTAHNTEDKKLARLLLQYIDLTCLDDNANKAQVVSLCQQAYTAYGQVAAICIWPQFVEIAKQEIAQQAQLQQKKPIPIATVANFPSGQQALAITQQEITNALAAGADEIDIVIPHHLLLQGKPEACLSYLKACCLHNRQQAERNKRSPAVIKFILESGALAGPAGHHTATVDNLIAQASQLAIAAGADFIKTSTGKITTGATPAAAEKMADAIAQQHSISDKKPGDESVVKPSDAAIEQKKTVGLKVSGGVSSFNDAKEYHHILCHALGKDHLSTNEFRIGSSGLLAKLMAMLDA